MGRYNFAASRVHRAATQLLETKRLKVPPPWYDVVANVPPPQQLVRPLQRTYNGKDARKNIRKPSHMFKPTELHYPEDGLRKEFFKDHPWELARPRIIVEEDGADGKKWDWSKIVQPGKKLDGESVVQRQRWLMQHAKLDKATAYDQARREFYDFRHKEAIEQRIAKEEAQAVGAYFGLGPLEVGMGLEDEAFEHWKAWALKEIELQHQTHAAMYSGADPSATPDAEDPDTLAATEELEDSIPATKAGQEARGGALLHP
ncbi:mitochondrial 37s ribosomal protein rsm25 [Diplodia corticola]|uniref:37S ribosomal protein S25, mitochondrial n=1 Tax=Diplodia corticola TaxID=236234 RepID=A0A1J9QL12_9PEZI|nr:mitochondrial 37s ribosomal protein rsm25 [Diplodia corticola]OJD28754.1 mitochondrial 37s ribosomal protein rsm25 [Diplodia corticola]